MHYIYFWLARIVADALAIAAFVAVWLFLWNIPSMMHKLRQRRCRHPEVFENRECSAICKSCRKDLGFIGKWREQNMRQELDHE